MTLEDLEGIALFAAETGGGLLYADIADSIRARPELAMHWSRARIDVLFDPAEFTDPIPGGWIMPASTIDGWSDRSRRDYRCIIASGP